MKTLATIPASDSSEKREDAVENSLTTEPVAVTQRMTKDGVLKIIFWYVASGNSAEEQEKGTQQENEEGFEARWMRSEDAVKILTFDDDKQITVKALQSA